MRISVALRSTTHQCAGGHRLATEVDIPAALSVAVFVGFPLLGCRPPVACGDTFNTLDNSPMRRRACSFICDNHISISKSLAWVAEDLW